jgi:ComF family protein
VDLVPLLTACVNTHFSGMKPDVITEVPLHGARERMRTYNQSGLLARGLAKRLGVPYLPHALSRVRRTATQTHLTASERRRNVEGAFRVGPARWVDGRRVLLVDDVMTTGATVNDCARALREAGACEIGVVTVARG